MDKRLKYFKENWGYDTILETTESSSFLEIISEQGGDISKFRIYGDLNGDPETFMVTEK